MPPYRAFDWYLPRALGRCPVCGEELPEWHGIDGPCEDLLWYEGEQSPTGAFRAGPSRGREAEPLAFGTERPAAPAAPGRYRLPPQFTIANSDRLHWITASGRCQDDVWTGTEMQAVQDLTAPYRDLFVGDALGRTRLFYLAAKGRRAEIKRVLFSLAGTGVWPQRLSLIEMEDHDGRTAADFADQYGHEAIAELLRREQERMRFFE